jgi:hypothetical protein
MTFVNYLDEMPFFLQEVLPRMESAGLRAPDNGAKAPSSA